MGLGSTLIDLSLQHFKDLHPSLLLLKLMLEYDLSPTISSCKKLVIKISECNNNDDSSNNFENFIEEERNYNSNSDDQHLSSSTGKKANNLLHYDRIITLLMKIINAEKEEDRLEAVERTDIEGENKNSDSDILN